PWSDLLARSLDEYSTEGPIAVCVHGLSSPSVETVGPDAPKPPRRSKAAPSGGCGCGRETGGRLRRGATTSAGARPDGSCSCFAHRTDVPLLLPPPPP